MGPTNPTPPTLADAMGNLAARLNDASGEMMYGHRWPEIQAAQAEARARAIRQDRLVRLLSVGVSVYLILAAVLLVAAAAVWAWRAAL